MGRPFIVDINLSDILNDRGETHYTMYIDDTKMTVVYELIEWIRWIFSLKHCVYLTHDNSVIHELEDIKILSVLKNVRVHNCDHLCVHTKLNHLFKKLNFFVQWDGIIVPKLFLNKVNEITKKLVQKEGYAEVIKNDCSEEETRPNEVGKVEVNKIKELHSVHINTCENQLSENLNSNVYASSKINFNMNSDTKLDDTAVNNFNEVHSAPFAKSEFVNVCNNNTTNFNTNSNIKLNDTTGMSNSNKVHSVLSDKYEYVHMNNINKTNSMGGIKLCDIATGLNNSNKVHSAQSDENELVNTPIKVSKCEIKKIKSLVDINLSEPTESNEYEEINKSNRKRFPSVSDDKKIHDNKIIKKVPKPFSVGELLTNLRSELNTSSTDHEINTSIEQNHNCLLSNGLINDRMGYFDQNLPSSSDGTVTKTKRKRQRQRRHRPRRLISRAPKLDNFLPLPKPEGDIHGTVKCYTPSYAKQSSHIRFASDDEDFSEANHPKSDKQSEKTEEHDLSKNNELVENGMEQYSLINGEEETLPMAQPNACDENNENKADNFSEASKEFRTLDKLVYLHDQKSSSCNLFEYSNEKNQQTNGESKTPDNYDFNLGTLRALKEKFPSPMVVERFY